MPVIRQLYLQSANAMLNVLKYSVADPDPVGSEPRCGGSLVGDVVAHWSEMWWLIGRRFGGSLRRCGGSLVARQTSGPEVPGSNPASPTKILGSCRVIV